MQEYEILVRTDGAEGRAVVRLAEPTIEAAKQRAAELHGVTYDDTQLLAIIDKAPQRALAF